MDHPEISIIFPTYNRASLLERVLPTYLHQREVKEIVIANHGSTDKTASLLEEWSTKDNRVIPIHFPSGYNMATMLNQSIEKSTGDYCFLSDDDVELTHDFFKILKSHLKEHEADLIAARRIWVQPWENIESATKNADRIKKPFFDPPVELAHSEMGGSDDLEVSILPAEVLVKRKVFDHVSFDPHYRGYPYRIESDLTFSAKVKGFKLIFCPHAVCYHIATKTFADGKKRSWLAAEKWRFKNHFYFLKKHRADLKKILAMKGSPYLQMIDFTFVVGIGQARNFLFSIKLSLKRAFQQLFN